MLGTTVLKGSCPRPEAFGAGVDEGSRALKKRVWMATVRKGYKKSHKTGSNGGDMERSGKTHPDTLSIPHSILRSLIHSSVCLSLFSQTTGSVILLSLSSHSPHLSPYSPALIPFGLRRQKPEATSVSFIVIEIESFQVR